MVGTSILEGEGINTKGDCKEKKLSGNTTIPTKPWGDFSS